MLVHLWPDSPLNLLSSIMKQCTVDNYNYPHLTYDPNSLIWNKQYQCSKQSCSCDQISSQLTVELSDIHVQAQQ